MAEQQTNGLSAQMSAILDTLMEMRYVGDVDLTQDGKRVAFSVAEVVPGEQRRRGHIWTAEVESGKVQPLTSGKRNETNPRWSPDGKALAFIVPPEGEKEKPQIHIMPSEGGEPRLLCKMPNGVSDLSWSPDGSRLAFISLEGEEPERDPKVLAPSRHRRLWTIRPDQVIPEPVIVPGITVWEYAWSPDSSQFALYYSTGSDDTDWYNSEIGVVVSTGGTIRQLTHLTEPARGLAWSPDSQQIAYLSGRWSDPGRGSGEIFVLSLHDGRGGSGTRPQTFPHPENGTRPQTFPHPENGTCPQTFPHPENGTCPQTFPHPENGTCPQTHPQPRNLTPGIECSPAWCCWLPDGRHLLYTAVKNVTHQIGLLDTHDGTPAALTTLDDDFVMQWDQPTLAITPDRRTFVTVHATAQQPPDVWYGALTYEGKRPVGVAWKQLSHLNPIVVGTLPLPQTERISYESVDGWHIDGLFTPPHQTEGTLPPLYVDVHGGPSGTDCDDWYSSNLVFAAAGFAVFHPNMRGSWGHGREFADAVLGDMGGKDFQDILNGIEYLVQQGRVDGKRVCIGGWSNGGFLSAWAIAQTDRFKAAMVGAGITDWHNQHAQSTIPDADILLLGADPLEDPDAYRRFSPITYARRVTTPTLILHGEDDPVVPVAQAYAFYRALKERNVPVECVIYPRAGHGVSEQKHMRDVYERMLLWFERYVK